MTRGVALLTGANRGIGLETARRLGARGYRVLLGTRALERGRGAATGLVEQGINAQAAQLDVSDDASVARAAELVAGLTDRLDAFVNNAGIFSSTRTRILPSETDLADMHAVYETNVFGIVRVTNAFLHLLRRARAARIVNVSSEVGSVACTTSDASPISSTQPVAQYPSSKAAVNMLRAQDERELAETPIRVNAANPGLTDTDLTSHRGIRPVERDAEPIVHLATLPDDGPSGALYRHVWTREGDGDGGYGVLPW